MHSASRTVLRALGLVAVALPVSSFAVIATTSTTTVSPVDTSFVHTSVGYFLDNNDSSPLGTIGSGIAISPYAILTAKHVTPAALNKAKPTDVGGVTNNKYVVSQYDATGAVTSSTSYAIKKVVDDPNADVRIVFLQTPVTTFTGLASSYSVNDTITMVGSGQSGLVDAAGQHYNVTRAQGVRRAGNNTIAQTETDGAGTTYLESFLSAPGDATLNNGDSGGAWFNASGLVVGLSDFTFNETPTDNSGHVKYSNYGFFIPQGGSYKYSTYFPGAAGTPNDYMLAAGESYAGSGAIDVTQGKVRTFIDSTLRANPVPEPSAFAALALGVVAVLRRKRR